ncbi:MAG: FadR/GntR family transcriptional regulator [Pseudomonadota bacterium]
MYPSTQIPTPFAGSRHRRAETIASDLRAMIMNNVLPIGQKLPTESMLCQQYDVSRTTLREAIQMLRSAGMLDVTPGRGSYVRAPNLGALIPALQLAGRSRGFEAEQTHALLHTLIGQALAQATLNPTQLRETLPLLHEHTLTRNADNVTAAQNEGLWYQNLLQLSGQPLYTFLGQILIPMFIETRRNSYKNLGADAILRTMELQLRVNSALAEGQLGAALRYLQSTIQLKAIQQAA